MNYLYPALAFPRQTSLADIHWIGICRHIQNQVGGQMRSPSTCLELTTMVQDIVSAMVHAGMLPPIPNISLNVREQQQNSPAWYERFETNPVLGRPVTGISYVIDCNFPTWIPEPIREQWLTAFSGTQLKDQQEYEAWVAEGMPGLIRPENYEEVVTP